MPADSGSDVRLEIGHVLFVDVVGYSKLLINEQRERLQLLNEIVRNTTQFRASDASGTLIRIPTGDGMALIFRDSLESPVRCALEISQTIKSHPEIQVRMGIHSGPVSEVSDVNEQTNIAGAGINMAQRVMDCGDAGHILLSKRVAEDLAEYRHWQPYLHELGECEVKHGAKISVVNLHAENAGNSQLPAKFSSQKRRRGRLATRRVGPIPGRSVLTAVIAVTIALLAIGTFRFFRPAGRKAIYTQSRAASGKAERAPTASTTDKSIAVLPFADLSQAKDQEYFCDGISEEILDALAKVEGLRVVARTSSFSFKGKNADVAEIAQKLNVQNVLEGSLRREGNRIRIAAQLINARDGFHVWSDTFERELQGVFAVQDEITRAIVDALKVKLAIAPAARARQNTEAYDLYLQGLYLSNKSDEESLRKSLGLFQRALEIDPNSARAWTGIAKAWFYLADAYVRPLEAYPKMREAASKALALDQGDADAHCYLGVDAFVLDWDVAGEEVEVNRALQLDRNSAEAHLWLAYYGHAMRGESEKAVVEIEEARKLDPLSPALSSWAAVMYLLNGQIDDAITEAERTLQLDPNYIYRDPILATAYRERGDYARAILVYKKAEEATGTPQPGLAITYAKMGRQNDARRILDKLKEISARKYVAADAIASIYAALGEKDEAFRWLEHGFEQHAGALYFSPEFRPLRSDPRFADLLRRIGIDPSKVLNQQKNR